MNDLKSRVQSAKEDLQAASESLSRLDKSAKRCIGAQFDGMHLKLKHGVQRSNFISSEVRTLLHQSLEFSDTNSGDLSPQINWMSSNFRKLTNDLTSAEDCAENAMNHAMTFGLQVLDVKAEVIDKTGELVHAAEDSKQLADDAKASQSWSERQIEDAQEKIDRTEQEIERLTVFCRESERRKEKTEQSITRCRQLLAKAQKRVENRKETAVLLGVGGVLLGGALTLITLGAAAPVGAVIAAGGVGGAIGTGISAEELKKKLAEVEPTVAEAEAGIVEAQGNINNCQAEMASLSRQKASHETNAKNYASLYSQFHEEEIEAKRMQVEIGQVSSEASSTRATASEMEGEFLHAKQELARYVSLLEENAIELTTVTSWLNPFLTAKQRKARLIGRQKKVIENAASRIGLIAEALPQLLPARGQKFLTWSGNSVSGVGAVELGETMPCL